MSIERTGEKGMSSTEIDLDLAAFFEKEFGSAAQRLSELGVQLLSNGPDHGDVSYYIRRQWPPPISS